MLHTYKAINLQEAYKTMLYDLMNEGLTTAPRGMETKEFIPCVFQIENPLSRIIALDSRKMNLFYAMIETMWYLNGDDALEPLTYYNKAMANFSDDGKILRGAYGARLIKKNQTLDKSQFGLVFDKLQKDPSSRQAVAIIWDPWFDHQSTKDVPCTVGFIFTIRENKLNMTTVMRSNDIVLGTTYDAFAFMIFQEFLARKLHVGVGSYTHVANSFHIYDRHYEQAWEMIKDTTPPIIMPEMPETSWTTFKDLYEFEHIIRAEETLTQNQVEAALQFGEYWSQWSLMFVLHKAIKDMNKEIAQSVYDKLIPQYKFMVNRWMEKLNG
jgi:thymidylate synthase